MSRRAKGVVGWLAALMFLGICGCVQAGWSTDGAQVLTWNGEQDPAWGAVSNAVMTNAANGAAAFAWGDHADAGYATGTPLYAESDTRFVTSVAARVSGADTSKWNQAHAWGDHAPGIAGLSNATWAALAGVARTAEENTFVATQRFERVATRRVVVEQGWVPARPEDFVTPPMVWISGGIAPWADGTTNGWFASENSEGMDHSGYFAMAGESTVFRVRWLRRRHAWGLEVPNKWMWYGGEYDAGYCPIDDQYYEFTSGAITNAYDGMSVNFDGLYSGTEVTDIVANITVEIPAIVTNESWVVSPEFVAGAWAVLAPGGATNWVTISNGWVVTIRDSP